MISIIVPVYNVESYLSQCVESILGQTLRDFELILIDDGSTDHSGAICDEFAKQDGRIRVIHQENRGVSRARNTGISLARGEWLCFVDADDILSSMFLQKFHARFNGISDYYIQGSCNVSNEIIETRSEYQDKDFTLGEDIIPSNILENGVPWGKLFSSAIVKHNNIRFNEHLNRGEDELFCMDFLYYTKKISTVAYNGYYYRRDNPSSLTNKNIDPMQLCLYNAQYERKLRNLSSYKGIKYNYGDREIFGSYKYAILTSISLNYDQKSFTNIHSMARQWLKEKRSIKKEKLTDYLFILLMSLPSFLLYKSLRLLYVCKNLRGIYYHNSNIL